MHHKTAQTALVLSQQFKSNEGLFLGKIGGERNEGAVAYAGA